jgi:hypothetical protein
VQATHTAATCAGVWPTPRRVPSATTAAGHPVVRAPGPPSSDPAGKTKQSSGKEQADTKTRKQLIRRLLLSAGIVVVLVEAPVLLSGISRLGFSGGKVLDISKVQTGVLQTLSDPASGYGANTVGEISCNNGRNPNADKGTTFTCDVTVNGAKRHVTVMVSDDNGTYEIDRPR